MGWVVNATPRLLNPREKPSTRRIGGWVDLRGAPTGIQSPDRLGML
jgi:hypothetical protein